MQHGYGGQGGGYPGQGNYVHPHGQQAGMVAQGHNQHGYQSHPMGELRVHTNFFVLQWVLFLVTTFIELNGQRQRRPWGHSTFPVAAGDYQLRVGFHYIFGPTGTAVANIRIYPGHVTQVRYDAPFIMFLSGSISAMPPVPQQYLPPARY
jgi:hypothetical protein